MRTRIIPTALSMLCLFLTLAVATVAYAYVRGAADSGGTPLFLHWTSWPVSFEINDQTDDGLPNLAEGSRPVEAIRRAYQSWNDIDGSHARFAYGGTTPIEQTLNDNHNVVTFVDHVYPYNGRVAVANYWYYTSTGELVDADIAFNPGELFSTQGVHPDHFDIAASCVHEVGHVAGLTHSGIMTVSMYPYFGAESLKSRRLWPDDGAGLADAYPGGDWDLSRGAVTGEIRRDGSPAFGAHVLLVDTHQKPIVGTLTLRDGSYRIAAVPPGQYQVVVEPLDRPVSQGNIAGPYWRNQAFDDDFPTLYLGGNEDPALITVQAGETTSGVDLDVGTQTAQTNARLIGRAERGVGTVYLYNWPAELPQGSIGEWDLYVAGEGLGSPATFEVLGLGVTRVTGFSYGNLGDGTPYAKAGFDVAASAPAGPRILRVDGAGEVSLLVAGVEVMPRPAQLTVEKDPLDPDAIYLTWYGGEAPYDLVRDTHPDLSTGTTIYSETDLDYSDPVRNDGATYFYRIDP